MRFSWLHCSCLAAALRTVLALCSRKHLRHGPSFCTVAVGARLQAAAAAASFQASETARSPEQLHACGVVSMQQHSMQEQQRCQELPHVPASSCSSRFSQPPRVPTFFLRHSDGCKAKVPAKNALASLRYRPGVHSCTHLMQARSKDCRQAVLKYSFQAQTTSALICASQHSGTGATQKSSPPSQQADAISVKPGW